MSDRVFSIVVADDEPDLRLLLRLQLARIDGLQIAGEAKDGREAVDLVLAGGVDAVVMDLLMPGTNGFEAIAMIQEQAPDVGLVAYTAVAGEFVRQEMARLGVPLVLKSGDVTPLASTLLSLLKTD